jgi:phospholipid/cholesterol/gamma-HCH transport system substrate-binding protein
MQDRANRRRISPSLAQSGVGLLILAALGTLIASIGWVTNFAFGGRSYKATFIFPNVGGMTVGTKVGYRGVRVGQVTGINPEPEGVAVDVQITPVSRLIPSNSIIEAVQSGLVGETTIDITPLQSVPVGSIKGNPLSSSCDSTIILCNGDRLQGQSALNVNTLIRSLLKISNTLSDPELIAAFRSLAQRTSVTLGKVNQFSGEATSLLKDAQKVGTIRDVNRGATSLGELSGGVNQLSGNLQGVSNLSAEATSLLRDLQKNGGLKNLDSTLAQAKETLVSVGKTADQLRGFLSANQTRIEGTLDSIKTTSDRLQVTTSKLNPLLDQVERSQIIGNLETISANTASLTKNLENLSLYLGDPKTIVLIQELLDSARAALENVNKVTSDLDQITGDPELRRQLIQLIRGLNNIISSTEQLQKDVVYGQTLTEVAAEIAAIAPDTPQKK